LSYDDIGGHKLNEGLVEKLTNASIQGCDQIFTAINEQLANNITELSYFVNDNDLVLLENHIASEVV